MKTGTKEILLWRLFHVYSFLEDYSSNSISSIA